MSVRRERNPLEHAMPWLSWPCIDWLRANLRSGLRVLEYGGGGSTLFFLAHGCFVTTVEGNRAWADAIRARAAADAERLDLRFVDSQTEDASLREQYATQCRIGAPWDLILVDGAFRDACIAAAVPYLRKGGILVVDNTDLPEFSNLVPAAMLGGYRRRVFRGLGYARAAPTTTEVFIAP